MTAADIRQQVEEAKQQAMKRFEQDYGPGAIDGLDRLRKNNAKALESICKALGR